jgi:hypothetical protein
MAIALLLLVDCRLASELRSTSHFVPVAGEERVRSEPGAQELGEHLAEVLPEALAGFARRSRLAPPQSVTVFACATIESFAAYTGSRRAGATATRRGIFVSPKPENTPSRLPGLLIHELSHLVQIQALGAISFVRRVPIWFTEGLAVYWSDGVGAESCSEERARELLRTGVIFELRSSGSLVERDGTKGSQLSQHEFYREAGMFVAFLDQRHEGALLVLLRGLEKSSFEDAFLAAFGESLSEAWAAFVQAT